jgi:hypothetical protein
VPLVAHGLAEYGIGGLCVAAPFLFSFDSDRATAAAVLIGGGILMLALLSDYPTAAVRRLPLESHIVLDYVFGVLLVAAPFIFGFSGKTGVTAFFVLLGLSYLALSLATRYRRNR